LAAVLIALLVQASAATLDASAAFRGGNVRPGELAFVVPSGTPTRPIFQGRADPLLIPFITPFIQARPDIWDQFTSDYSNFGEIGVPFLSGPGLGTAAARDEVGQSRLS
jgi:hypothetical protein